MFAPAAAGAVTMLSEWQVQRCHGPGDFQYSDVPEEAGGGSVLMSSPGLGDAKMAYLYFAGNGVLGLRVIGSDGWALEVQGLKVGWCVPPSPTTAGKRQQAPSGNRPDHLQEEQEGLFWAILKTVKFLQRRL